MGDSTVATPPRTIAAPPAGSEPPAPCPFLDKLPAEMRNEIYEMAFSPGGKVPYMAFIPNSKSPVDLFSASPPQSNILATCSQIHHEAKGIYKDAYRKYWKETEFSLDIRCNEKIEDLSNSLSGLPPDDLNNVQNLSITYWPVGRFDPSRTDEYTLEKEKGIIRVDEIERSHVWDEFNGEEIVTCYFCCQYDKDGDVEAVGYQDEEEARKFAAAQRDEVPLRMQLE